MLVRETLLGAGLVTFAFASPSWAIDVVLEQHPGGFSSFVASTAFPTWEADDFICMTSDYLIDRVSWWGGRNDPHAPVVSGFHIRFYDSVLDAGLGFDRPGDLLSDQYVAGDAGQQVDVFSHAQYYSYTADLPMGFFAMGLTRYWVSIVADLSGDPNDSWWGWRTSGTTNFATAVVKSSGSDFVRISDPPFSMPYQDMALVLEGRAVPAPWVVAPLAVPLMSRRRRR